jgi:hypothetical protein
VREIFQEYEEWTIAIFDNLLILCHSLHDAFEKFKKIIRKAREFNVIFKMSKTWLGVRKVTFFGYELEEGCFGLSHSRRDGVLQIPMPTNVKQLQQFLGVVLFFKPFVSAYSDLTAPLNEMVHKSFSWDKSTWKVDYEAAFERVKQAALDAMKLYYPDYNLDWVLVTDASEVAVASVLYQIKPSSEGAAPQNQPIVFHSAKFSKSAKNWDMFKREAYGNYFGIKSNEFLVRAKPFVLETAIKISYGWKHLSHPSLFDGEHTCSHSLSL